MFLIGGKILNYLNRPWREQFELPSFDNIRTNDFLPALHEAIALAKENIGQIVQNSAHPNFSNTVEALEKSDVVLSRLAAIFFNLVGANSDSGLEAIQVEFVKSLSVFYSEVLMNKKIYSRLKELDHMNMDPLLTAEQRRVLNLYQRDYIRSGVNLSEANQLKLAKVTTRLAELGTKFSQNILAEEREWRLDLSENDLNGLPYDLVSILKQSGLDRGCSSPILTLSRSHLVPFLESSSRRDLRKKAFLAWVSRGANKNENNNYNIIAEVISLRKERANLLGFKNFSSFKLQNEMARNPENVKDFLHSVLKPAKKRALKELNDLKQIMKSDGMGESLMAWDWRYYQSKSQEKHLDFNPMELKAYLKIDSIIEAAFYVANKLFNLDFLPISYVSYHPDVKCWEVRRNGKHVGVFLGDYFARTSKRSGAWCSSLRSQSKLHKEETPIVINVCNFAKPGKKEEALLTIDDATTLFHEFGHALHNLLSNVTYSRISGTSVARDFVELPSQLFEHWLLTPEVLDLFAINIKTGKSMPKKLSEKLLKSMTFGTGFATVEYLASAIVDISIHTEEPSSDPEDFQNKILSELEIPEGIVMRHSLSNFSHIFSGDGYSSGYYSYLWSEVMDADAFEAFKDKNNFFDEELARKLETFIYGAGGSREPEKLYELFRGRAPTIGALLRGRGLAEE